DSNVYEVDDLSESEPVEKIGSAAGHTQSQSEEGGTRRPPSHRHDHQGEQERGVPDSEQRCPCPGRPIRTETQERARVLDVLKPARVAQKCPVCGSSEHRGRDVLGRSVTRDGRADRHQQNYAKANSPHHRLKLSRGKTDVYYAERGEGSQHFRMCRLLAMVSASMLHRLNHPLSDWQHIDLHQGLIRPQVA